MKAIKYSIMAVAVGLGMAACTDLDEKVYDRIDSSVYYQNEASVQGAVAAIYKQTGATLGGENFFFLSEFSADQITWRAWNGGAWGWDNADKIIVSWQQWSPNSEIIKRAWSKAWTGVGLANLLLSDLEKLSAADLHMSDAKLKQYIAEVRTIRAWNYYCLFELWGGALPLNTSASSDVPGTADPDWDTSCKKIYDFIAKELDESNDYLEIEDGSHSTVNRASQGMNRLLKARLLLNAKLFIGEDHFQECEDLSKEIIKGTYGAYELDDNYRNLYSVNNVKSPEVIFAFAVEDGKDDGDGGITKEICNVRTMVGMVYDYPLYFGKTYDGIGGWNCVCLVPSYDNYYASAEELKPNGGTTNPRCFLDAPYGDKLGAPYERFDNRDIRKQNVVFDNATKMAGPGMFLKGPMTVQFPDENHSKGTPIKVGSGNDRENQVLDFVDQIGTFMNYTGSRPLEPVMSPRWGEANSGIRLVKYPLYATDEGGFKDIDDVRFRLAEAYYNVAECEMRKGNSEEAKKYVDEVRKRYFKNVDRTAALAVPGPGFENFDMDWMLSEWGKEYLGEGDRRRTDLRRFDKFTQGQWWFWGRTSEDGYGELPAKRDRKYEWYPLPETAISVNPGLIQNPAYQ